MHNSRRPKLTRTFTPGGGQNPGKPGKQCSIEPEQVDDDADDETEQTEPFRPQDVV